MSRQRSYKRQKPFREPGQRILVVTEGTVTEPRYFSALLVSLSVSPRTVVVCPSSGSDPITVVDTALRIMSEAKKSCEPSYDSVWLVFDTESNRVHLPEAINKAKAYGYKLAVSAPSIEYWFLLHFVCSDRYMANCHEVKKELCKYYDYSKEGFDTSRLVSRTDTGISNARLLRRNQEGVEKEFPKTDVDLLVTEINALADSANRLFDWADNVDCLTMAEPVQ